MGLDDVEADIARLELLPDPVRTVRVTAEDIAVQAVVGVVGQGDGVVVVLVGHHHDHGAERLLRTTCMSGVQSASSVGAM